MTRGAQSNRENRFATRVVEPFDDGWSREDEPASPLETTVTIDQTRTIIARNDSPDVHFEQSINPYRGCEHGCMYCFARPTHSYLDLSPGLDFESRLFAKPNAPELLRRELAYPRYVCKTIVLGSNTDAYQPIERTHRITRGVLEVFAECDHPVEIVTKSALVLRDLDLLVPMAAKHLARVFVSITTLDRGLARRMEPRAATPERRLHTVRALHEAGVPVGVLIAPVIPALTDHELESIVAAVAEAGALTAGYVLLRLPHELTTLVEEWLREHYPLRADHVLNVLRDMRGGKLYDAAFGKRKRGEGRYAELLAQRFAVAARRAGVARELPPLDTTLFRAPRVAPEDPQLTLFDGP